MKRCPGKQSYIFKCLNKTAQNNNTEGCHWLGKANPQNTIVRFVHRKNF